MVDNMGSMVAPHVDRILAPVPPNSPLWTHVNLMLTNSNDAESLDTHFGT